MYSFSQKRQEQPPRAQLTASTPSQVEEPWLSRAAAATRGAVAGAAASALAAVTENTYPLNAAAQAYRVRRQQWLRKKQEEAVQVKRENAALDERWR